MCSSRCRNGPATKSISAADYYNRRDHMDGVVRLGDAAVGYTDEFHEVSHARRDVGENRDWSGAGRRLAKPYRVHCRRRSRTCLAVSGTSLSFAETTALSSHGRPACRFPGVARLPTEQANSAHLRTCKVLLGGNN